MIHVKEGVRFSPCTPELIDGIISIVPTLAKFNYDLVITSGSDGVHPAGGDKDPHYLGYAVDIRTRDMRVQDVPTVVRELRLTLGAKWVVVQEGDHIHLQHEKFKDVLAVPA